MSALLPFLALYRRHWFWISLGIVLATLTLLASIGLLTLSGWLLAGTALAGSAGLYSFNYLLPAAGIRAAAMIRTVGRYAERVVNHDATFRVLADLRVFTFKKILQLSPASTNRFQQSDLLNRLVADVDTLDHLYLRVIAPFIAALVVILVVTYGLTWLDVTLAFTLGIILLGLLLLLPMVFYRAGKPIGEALTHLRSRYRCQLTRCLQGQAELLVFGAFGRFRTKLEKIEQRWLAQQQQQASLVAIAQSLMIFASGLTVTLLLWLVAENMTFTHREGNNQSAELIALLVFTTIAAFEALSPVATAFQYLGQVITSARRVLELITKQSSVVFPHRVTAVAENIELEIKQVSFTYPNQPLPVLQNISLSIAAGEHIAIVGRTGCGKSTLLQLLTRAWDVTQGDIFINQQPLANFNEKTLRQMMVVVSQRIHIFSDTLRANLLLASPLATDNSLETVLNQVGLQNLLENSEGLNAWLGEGGRSLSGGEQRRLGVARALLHPAPLLLLDEPTEGLDATTEQQILSLLRQHGQHKSMILITHRLYGLDTMDRICVMDAGRIVEQGDHRQLMNKKGRYYQLGQWSAKV
ncbi:thiol reductant ABC exporter, CydC subunit [Candidatus Regiella insecticola 5.15]|uniref:Glutathione/L-cysteine transport system ATP-binding/permease protein CydC n=1 Tax=Candidatus Regiella insecticola 5.15 TaxID=1005043 RepID=G2GXV2_9ENTR|nr:cysteine/glutathione ABC transporter ATP-binding protein/permease CydC [Candidatus Regiella insecticola]EGY29432.1 thiol reductant ABC exporter, CydC subunit [Candidatus Regiella insecticola 5.15]